MPVCLNYNFKFWHVFFPPKHLIYKICLIRDKSKLFLSSFLRLLLYFFIFDFLYSNKYIKLKSKKKKYKIYIGISLLIIVALCAFSLFLVVLKSPELDEMRIEKEVKEEVKDIEADPDTKSGLETRSLGRSEVEKIFLPETLEVPGRIKSIS